MVRVPYETNLCILYNSIAFWIFVYGSLCITYDLDICIYVIVSSSIGIFVNRPLGV